MNLPDAGDAQAAREADAELLSLALIDARNMLLQRLAGHEEHEAALRLAAAAGAWQDLWIGRHVQRQRGEGCDASATRLPPADAAIDRWLAAAPGDAEAPPADEVRRWLAETLETTLDLLAAVPKAGASDAALHFFRAALRHEDRLAEALAEWAAEAQRPGAGAPPQRPVREPLSLPAQAVLLGSPCGGCVPENERWAHEVAVPEFEIDAQAVTWRQYAEFAEDGGYDRRELWGDAGWAWLQAGARRAPRHVEQLRGGVLVQRQGQLQRVAAGQPVLHVSRHEAEAWCRWAGRRLPTEPEWTAAALGAGSRGFVWGDVFEWVAGSARGWPGGSAGPGALDALPAPGTQGVLRGASWLTRRRQRHPQARRFAPPEHDTAFCGFRSCAV